MLLDWYAIHARALPWRGDPDPFHVLVSEFMLQQTQVDRVLGKYQAFLERFPTIERLAEAPVADVIRAWRPLGYNRRAVRLWSVSRQIVDKHGGVVPQKMDELQAPDGVGRYTASAIASFAYCHDVAAVDTNVRRVLRRVYDGLNSPNRTARKMLELADEFVPVGRGADWNQATMDLGATICTAQRPRCDDCPLASVCVALEEVRTAGGDRAAYFAEHERKKPGRDRQQRFAGSNRYFRGKVVAALGALPYGATMTLPELGKAIREDESDYDADWLGAIVDGLAKDGLIEVDMPDYDGDVPSASLPRG